MDIIVGASPIDFDHPRLCVQVKFVDQPVDVKVLRELQGVMSNYGAEQGLFISLHPVDVDVAGCDARGKARRAASVGVRMGAEEARCWTVCSLQTSGELRSKMERMFYNWV